MTVKRPETNEGDGPAFAVSAVISHEQPVRQIRHLLSATQDSIDELMKTLADLDARRILADVQVYLEESLIILAAHIDDGLPD